MNGRNAAVFLPYEVLKYFINALKWKEGDSSPIQCNMCCVS